MEEKQKPENQKDTEKEKSRVEGAGEGSYPMIDLFGEQIDFSSFDESSGDSRSDSDSTCGEDCETCEGQFQTESPTCKIILSFRCQQHPQT